MGMKNAQENDQDKLPSGEKEEDQEGNI